MKHCNKCGFQIADIDGNHHCFTPPIPFKYQPLPIPIKENKVVAQRGKE